MTLSKRTKFWTRHDESGSTTQSDHEDDVQYATGDNKLLVDAVHEAQLEIDRQAMTSDAHETVKMVWTSSTPFLACFTGNLHHSGSPSTFLVQSALSFSSGHHPYVIHPPIHCS